MLLLLEWRESLKKRQLIPIGDLNFNNLSEELFCVEDYLQNTERSLSDSEYYLRIAIDYLYKASEILKKENITMTDDKR